MHVGGGFGGGGGAASSSGGGGGGGGRDVATLEWYEPLARVGALEESSAELVLHLRDGGMRFVPIAASAADRHECYRIVSDAWSSLQAAE